MSEREENLVIGITGASGQLGRQVLEYVVERVGAGQVVAITRSPDELADVVAQGVDVRAGDFADADGLAEAFQGIDRLYMISIDDVREGVRPRLHGNAIHAAKAAGVQHIVYASALKPQHSPMRFLHDHAATEQLVVESGLAYTFLRNSFYAEVVLQSGAQSVASGTLFSAAADGAVAYISREDCARVAATVLTTDGHEDAVYDVTGTYAWTQAEIARELGKVVGRTIQYVPLSDAAKREGMLESGVPPQLVEMLVGIDRGVRLGALDVVSRAVVQLTGTPPESLPEFLARHKAQLLGEVA